MNVFAAASNVLTYSPASLKQTLPSTRVQGVFVFLKSACQKELFLIILLLFY
jgi:hypothetical protein